MLGLAEQVLLSCHDGLARGSCFCFGDSSDSTRLTALGSCRALRRTSGGRSNAVIKHAMKDFRQSACIAASRGCNRPKHAAGAAALPQLRSADAADAPDCCGCAPPRARRLRMRLLPRGHDASRST
jgi:hypothetical protein